MKNKQTNVGSFATAKLQAKRRSLLAIALVAVIGFGLTACPDDSNDNKQPLFSVSGEFKGAGSGNALFKAATTETVSRAAMSADASYELTGELEDGDILFRLRGTFDSSTGSYIASSASSFARYTINGDESGATATLAVKQGDEWISFIVSVTVKEVSVKDGNAQDEAGGLPSWAQGSWHDWWTKDLNDYKEQGFEVWSYFDQWYYEAWRSSVWHDNWDYTSTKYTVIKAEPLGNDVYDVIFSYPFYKADDAQIKTALENFFRDNNHPAEFWNKKCNPWDHDVWTGRGDNEGKNYDNSLIWYICMNENHPYYLGTIFINWDTFIKIFDTEEKRNELWEVNKDGVGGWYERMTAVENFFTEKNISNYYYWGWNEPDWEEPYEDRAYTCWEPTCEEGWWDKTHYYVKGWGNQTGIQGDWDRYGDLFSKWASDDYLVTYLRSQNVQPETWYTRVRIRMEGDTFIFQYYNGENGDNEAEKSNSHSAPPCDTRSLSKIESLTFDPDYWGWTNFWQRQRTSPRN